MNLYLTKEGQEVLQYNEELAAQYKYRRIPEGENKEKIQMNHYRTIPQCFIGDAVAVYNQKEQRNGYEVCPIEGIPIYSRTGTLIASKYERIVIGDYGAFIEIDPADMVMDHI